MLYQTKLVYGHNDTCKLSIVIPTYRVNQLTLRAISSALNQTKFTIDYNVIVVVNNPNIDYSFLIEKFSNYENFNIFVNSQTVCMSENFNICAMVSKSQYIAYLHDDDYLYNFYLNKIEYFLIQNKYKCIIPGRFIETNDSCYRKRGKIKSILSTLLFFRYLYRKKLTKIDEKKCLKAFENCFYAPSCGTLFDRESFLNYGGFSNQYNWVFDYDFFIKYSKENDVFLYHRYLSVYSMFVSESNKTDVKIEFWKYNNELIEKFPNYKICYSKEAKAYNYHMWDDETKELIRKKFNYSVNYNKVKYLLFIICRFIYKTLSNLDNIKFL